jgi:adenosine deaminase
MKEVLTLPEIIEIQKVKNEKKFINDVLKEHDLLDVFILKEFYTNDNFPNDIVPRSLNEVYNDLRSRGVKVSKPAVSYRLKKFAEKGFLVKLNSSYPAMFLPISSEEIVTKVNYILRIIKAVVK